MSVHIMGGAQTDFAVNWQRAGASFDALVRTVLEEALDAARVAVTDIGVIHVGNAFGQLFTGQGHLGGMPATVHPELWGVPASRHEAACASGSMAALAAMADLESGRYDCALVLGAELEKTVPGAQAAAYMGAAAWAGHETLDTDLVWPTQFAAVADEYDRRYGLDPAHLRAISELNITNARLNPNAQTRDWRYGEAAFTADDAANPPVAGMLRCQDCSQMTDGAAAVVLVSDRFLKRHNDIRVDRTAVITGGVTAPSACRSTRSSASPRPISTSSRTSAPRSSTPCRGRGLPTSTSSTVSKCTTASPCRSTWPSTTSASPPRARTGKPWNPA